MSLTVGSWKDIGDNQDGGNATTYGGLDTRKIMRYFLGQLNIDNVVINSPTAFRNTKFRLTNPAGTQDVTVNAGAVTSSPTYTFPVQNSNDEILLANASQIVKGKTLNFADNTFIGFGGATATNRKTGRIQATRAVTGGSASEGLLQGHIDMATIASAADPPPYGLYWNYSTGTTSQTNAGLRYAITWIRRQYNPRIKIKARVPTTAANCWFLFGLSVDVDIQANEVDPIDNTESAFLIGWRNTDSNITIFRNGGTNAATATPTVVNTGAGKPTEVTTYEIDMRSSGDVVVTIINGATGASIFSATYTTNLPVTDIMMRPVFQIKNTDSVNHDLWLHYMEQEQDV